MPVLPRGATIARFSICSTIDNRWGVVNGFKYSTSSYLGSESSKFSLLLGSFNVDVDIDGVTVVPVLDVRFVYLGTQSQFGALLVLIVGSYQNLGCRNPVFLRIGTAHHESHLVDDKLPYRIRDWVAFADRLPHYRHVVAARVESAVAKCERRHVGWWCWRLIDLLTRRRGR